jgi:DNA processing protein
MNELDALLILAQTPLLGSIKIRMLIKHFGSSLAVLDTSPTALVEVSGIGPKLIDSLSRWKERTLWQKDLETAHRYGVQIIPYTDPQYPKRLLNTPDFPLVLYCRGELQSKDTHSIAVVGTRNCSIYGKEMAFKISDELCRQQFTVVSGLARGIDTAAHHGALKSGRTIAVIACGLCRVYPEENVNLAQVISENGAILSEYPMTTPPDKLHFPQRNRIVSGMTQGSLLIEAPRKSGAMITMNKAKQQGRPTFALPGRADHMNFQGNHQLIKEGSAQLIENGEDIASHFDQLFSFAKPATKVQVQLPAEEKNFFDLLPEEELTIDEIARLSETPIAKVNVMLMTLLLKKKIREYPGKIYKKI